MQTPLTPSAGTAQPAGPAPGLIYAGFGIRLVALIVDFLVIGAIGGLVADILGLGFIGLWGADWRDLAFWHVRYLGGTWLAWLVLQALISGAYFVYSWTHWSATPGQRLMNLQVRMDNNGSQPSQDVAIKRWALLTVPIVGNLPVFGFLVFVYQLYLAWTTSHDPNKQGFHDQRCGTVVVREL